MSSSAARLIELATASIASNTLAPGTEETFHAVEAASILLSCWLSLALPILVVVVVKFLMGSTSVLVLQTSAVVPKPRLTVSWVVRRY